MKMKELKNTELHGVNGGVVEGGCIPFPPFFPIPTIVK
jgi:hypothetical protein